MNHRGQMSHFPVMLPEVLQGLKPVAGGHYIDATFGRGGYSRAILASCDCFVTALDRDPSAIAAGAALRQEFAGRLDIRLARFSTMDRVLALAAQTSHQNRPILGIVFDLGVSSPQLDEAERGFSFRQDGPLDMRMGCDGVSAAELVNSAAEEEIADALHHLGEERFARRIAAAIVKARAEKPITRTAELAALIARVTPRPSFKASRSKETIDPATRSFQALRIWVNDELGELQQGLEASLNLLGEGGRLAVVSFHSLEDRIVKQFILDHSQTAGSGISRHMPITAGSSDSAQLPPLINLTRRPLYPAELELETNSRSRSARLRLAQKQTGGGLVAAAESGGHHGDPD
ncbi:MAG: 16S rRNA (cytosine(1402)-N(4))-methyltransferase RsmH [Candidatus Pacebacteria bacterium]|nr:16S rRNA (cytosine(1402)-N(4))-methyltransferase RsmH [Candidatus Paceibacterota bacterium]